MLSSLLTHRAALDASDTGTGKTYTALGVANELGSAPLVICPKSVKSAWREVANSLGVPLTDVCNIEQIKTGKTPYLKRVDSGKKGVKPKWVWTVPRDTFLIYDEVQTASGYDTQNSKILALAKAYGLRALMLSATVADSPLKLRAVGYLLGLHKWRDNYTWCLQNGCYKNPHGGLSFVTGVQRLKYLKAIHDAIFPEKGVRVRIEDLEGFPENAIFAEAYDLDKYTDDVNKIYGQMDEELKDPESNQSPLTIMLRARQQAELFKVPLMEDMTKDLLDEGKSVVLFVNFVDTLKKLNEAFPDSAVIIGGQTERGRTEEWFRFQHNDTRVMLAMIQAGGVGLSLHDKLGGHPRVSLISPTYSAVDLKQALGRIPRDGGKSKCIQKILFAAGTVEEDACKAVRRKLDNVSMLNDGDLRVGILDKEK